MMWWRVHEAGDEVSPAALQMQGWGFTILGSLMFIPGVVGPSGLKNYGLSVRRVSGYR
jgi:hypothetical protein